jgi:hypothetical protein
MQVAAVKLGLKINCTIQAFFICGFNDDNRFLFGTGTGFNNLETVQAS